MCAILGGLIGVDFVKVMHCTTTKVMWDKLKNIYEGDLKVRKTKLHTHRSKFEQLKVKDDEDIAVYLLKIDDVVNTMLGLGEEIKEEKIVEKILRSFPARFDSKVSAIEEMKDLEKLSKDDLHGILIAYEMRIDQGNPSRGEATVKTTKKSSNPKLKPYSNCKDDDKEVNFTKRLQRGTGKYKR